jgi:hypothetical protein
MTHQKKPLKHSIEIVKKIIKAHQRLVDAAFVEHKPEIQAILHQMMHGKPQHKSIKLYQYLLESFLFAGGGDQSNLAYYAKQQYKPTFHRIKRAVTAMQCPKLVSFEAFK